MTAVEENSGVSNKITSFTLPLGATINMDGTALYECVAVMFIAQAYGFELNFGQQIIVVILAVLTAIGAAGVPGGSLPLMMLVMATVGVPPEGIAIILGVDRILDMSRTTLNVCGDISASVYVDRVDREIEGMKPAEPLFVASVAALRIAGGLACELARGAGAAAAGSAAASSSAISSPAPAPARRPRSSAAT